MDFALTADQREIQALAREVAQAEIEPNAAAWDREHRFPTELYEKLGELGLMGVCVPSELGGAGADFLSYILVLEELSRADAGVGVTVAVHTSACTLPILAFGTEEQRERFVPPLASGQAIGAFALTEPEAGSDAGSIRTRADADGDGWTITGAKQWITNGSYAGTFLTFARSEPEIEGARGVSAFLLDAEHVRVTREEEKLGLNSSSTVDLVIEGAQVGRDRLLHEEGRGFAIAMATLDGGRIGIAAQALGIAQAAYDVAREYAKERRTFGKRIAEHQAIQFKLADMSTEIDAARLLVYRAAWLKEQGEPHTEAGAKAKLFASEMARRQTAEAIQILGGYGYTKEFPVERYYRDAKITEIYEGTSEIQRLVIARRILDLQREPATQRDEPVRLTRIYTRGGDQGETSLGDGSRVSKLDCRIGAFGTVDELNSALGVVLAGDVPDAMREPLARIQNELFDVGADLSVPWGVTDRLRVEQAMIDAARAALRRLQRRPAGAAELRPPGRHGGVGAAARRADDLPPRRARRPARGAGGRPEPARAPLPEPALRPALHPRPRRERREPDATSRCGSLGARASARRLVRRRVRRLDAGARARDAAAAARSSR